MSMATPTAIEDVEDFTENDTRFRVKTWKEDLTVVVEEKELYVSKVVLAGLSPVFDRMFSSELKEKSLDRLPLTEKDYDSFVEFLCCIYPGGTKQITDKNIEIVLPLIDEYQVNSVKDRCEAVLLERMHAEAATEDVYHSLSLACEYGFEELKERCIDIASERNIDDMMRAKENHGISAELHEKVLARSVKRLQLDVKEYCAALISAKQQSNEYPEYTNFTSNVISASIPKWHGYLFYSPRRNEVMDYDKKRGVVKALRLSTKLEQLKTAKILLRTCSDLSLTEIKEIENEIEVQCLPTAIKDFILKKKSAPPEKYLWI